MGKYRHRRSNTVTGRINHLRDASKPPGPVSTKEFFSTETPQFRAFEAAIFKRVCPEDSMEIAVTEEYAEERWRYQQSITYRRYLMEHCADTHPELIDQLTRIIQSCETILEIMENTFKRWHVARAKEAKLAARAKAENDRDQARAVARAQKIKRPQ